MLRSICLWLSAVLLVSIPFLLALDFGGFLQWSRYVAAQGVLAALCLALPGLTERESSSGMAQHLAMLPVALLAAFAWFQTVALPADLVAWMSPGSADAYLNWLGKLVPVKSVRLSISPVETQHAACVLTVMLSVMFSASIVFHKRSRLTFLLSAIALAGAATAVMGIYRKLDPGADIWFFNDKTSAFAGFYNRNNAALFLNLGLGASLGLLSWRTTALHQIELDDPDFELNDLFSLVTDRESFIGLASATLCAVGLLLCGSRGGMVAAMAGMVMAFGYARPQRGLICIPVMIVTLAISIAILTVPLKLDLASIQRLELISNDADTLQRDGRLSHWPDGWRAAKHYFPFGSGMATYEHAYTPFQETSPPVSRVRHADNLWLTMFVETGLVGIVVIGLMIVVLMRSLRHLGYSPDPIDQGIRIAGSYCLATLIVSQIFDFGLVSTANLIICVLIATAIVSRDVANGGSTVIPDHDVPVIDDPDSYDREDSVPKIRLRDDGFRSRVTQLAFPTTVGLLVLGVGILTLPRLRMAAQSHDVYLQLKNGRYLEFTDSPPALAAMEASLSELFDQYPDPHLGFQLLVTLRDLGQLQELKEWRPQSDEDEKYIRRSISLRSRKLPYPPAPSKNIVSSVRSQASYLKAWRTGQQSLRSSPLFSATRYEMLLLHPIVWHIDLPEDAEANGMPSPELFVTLLDQAQQQCHRSPDLLVDVGMIALSQEAWSHATNCFSTASHQRPSSLGRILSVLETGHNIQLADVVAQESEAMRIAARAVLKWESPDDDFLRSSIQWIRCSAGGTLSDRAQCERLAAEIHYHLQQDGQGNERLERAIGLTPSDARLRLFYIENLKRQNDREAALKQARMGRQSFPDNPQFQNIIAEMAESDRVERLAPNDPLQQTNKTLNEILQ